VKLRLLVVAVALSLVPSALAEPGSADGPGNVDARAYVVADGRNGELLLARNPRERVPIASITKLMTVLLALERSLPDDVVNVAPYSAGAGESLIRLRPGEQLTVRELIEASLIQSANDAAWALAAHIGQGDVNRFVALMNRRARQLGLRDTHFLRPDGLDVPGHVSSARDVTELARIAMRKPLVRELVDEKTATIAGGRRLHTWNDLLYSFPGVVGVKTGHTRRAGWSQVAAARGQGVTVYATLLGGPSRGERNTDLAALLRWGLERFRVVPLIRARHAYARAETPYDRGTIDLVAPRPVLYAARVGQRLLERVVAPAVVELPVARGERLGEVRIFDRGHLVVRSPLVAARSVGRPGPLGRAGWYAGETLRNVGGWFR
jgi:serine-type D-Ala-D-Ala carboxypeptidase (penicillin-binding protein 5/6)